jgi:nitric oxide reductase NorQ protein
MTTPATPPTPPPASATAATSGASVPRLRNGELRAMVARVLADAGTDLTPRNIAHTLNRSSGAVGNALKVLTDRGEAEVTSTTPLAYRATATTASAAATTATPAPSGPHQKTPRRHARPIRRARDHARPVRGE